MTHQHTTLGALLRAKLEGTDEAARAEAALDREHIANAHPDCNCGVCWPMPEECEPETVQVESEPKFADLFVEGEAKPKWLRKNVRITRMGENPVPPVIKVEASNAVFRDPVSIRIKPTVMGLLADVAGTMHIPKEQVAAAILNNAENMLRNMLSTHVEQTLADERLRLAERDVEQAYAAHGYALSCLFGETNQYAADEAQ
jgi:hypothetical protein